MAATTEELLQMILQSLEKVEYIKSEDIPNICLLYTSDAADE